MANTVQTEHPHIVRRDGVCGGEPVIDGLRVTVRHVATLHLRGEAIPDIAEALGLTEAQVFHALSYFSDHREEIQALIAQEERGAIERCRAAGLMHYTLKPVRRRSLAERVRVALGETDAQAPDEVALDEATQLLTGLRVLLAEDNPINALLARTLLTRAGCIVTTVHDGEEAVTVARSGAYDLILLDIRMPRLDGLAAAERIRASGGPSAGAPGR